MSFTSHPEAQARLHRCELALPGSNEARFEKAAGARADVAFPDREDAISPQQKAERPAQGCGDENAA